MKCPKCNGKVYKIYYKKDGELMRIKGFRWCKSCSLFVENIKTYITCEKCHKTYDSALENPWNARGFCSQVCLLKSVGYM